MRGRASDPRLRAFDVLHYERDRGTVTFPAPITRTACFPWTGFLLKMMNRSKSTAAPAAFPAYRICLICLTRNPEARPEQRREPRPFRLPFANVSRLLLGSGPGHCHVAVLLAGRTRYDYVRAFELPTVQCEHVLDHELRRVLVGAVLMSLDIKSDHVVTFSE